MKFNEFNNPAIAYTAHMLESFANEYSIPTDEDSIAFVKQIAPDQVRRFGHALGDSVERYVQNGLGRKFEVAKDVPATIPLLLGRLAMFDRREQTMSEGVSNEDVSWLRLANVQVEDPRIDEILAIVGATRSVDHATHLDTDPWGKLFSVTEHPYIELPDYAVSVSELPRLERVPGLSLIRIAISLPEIA